MSTKPVIFISYSHKDEPEKRAGGEIQWLTFVREHLQPAVKEGVFNVWVDRTMRGGVKWDPEIERKLRDCDIFILLVSRRSMASCYIVDKEIEFIRERRAKGDDVYFYPLLLTPTPEAGLSKIRDQNLRPRDAKPFSSFSYHERLQHMTEAANEIAAIAKEIVRRKSAEKPSAPSARPAYVHITGLPETPYERLVGREKELQRLDDAWADRQTNILSLIAEGGAGKSALVNEWLNKLQADHYRGAKMVLGWSFYSQGTKERATSADQFLGWALKKFGIKIRTTSASAKGDAIAEAMGKRRVLLVLDGVEPLQHGPGGQQGELKDAGLRALLRRFATIPPTEGHGLVVLTSRVAVKDIARRKDGAAPILDVEKLSDNAGAALLRDNGVWGIDSELKAATQAFEGHPLALDLLASFLRETRFGDVRRRDHVRAYLADKENSRHDHARRVMESYEKEWLAGQPVPRAIMHIVGLFDRPVSSDCLRALRTEPAIEGLTEAILGLDAHEWQRAVARLRNVRLLAPPDPSAPDELDAHPLVREWFGERLEQRNRSAWLSAHGRLYEHLRDTTKEGKRPTLSDLAPLYQAIAHGSRAGRHQEALQEIYVKRICRKQGYRSYATNTLGAFGSDLAAISWFFDKPFEIPVASLNAEDRSWVLSQAAYSLSALGRVAEALPPARAGLQIYRAAEDWGNAATSANNLSEAELLAGEVAAAVVTAQQSVHYARQSAKTTSEIDCRSTLADALHAAGEVKKAERRFAGAERRQRRSDSTTPFLLSVGGYQYCDLIMAKGDYAAARDRAKWAFGVACEEGWVLEEALDRLTIGRAHLGLALKGGRGAGSITKRRENAYTSSGRLDKAVNKLRAFGDLTFTGRGLLARATFCRVVGDWDGTVRDLNEVEEIAKPGRMRLYLGDTALERARLAFAQIEAFAPLNGLIDDGPPKPVKPDADEATRLMEQARVNVAKADSLIKDCGYHRRDEELAELHAVLKGERTFADLPSRV
jgi:hypothetical protein